VRVKGKVGSKTEEFLYEVAFPEVDRNHDNIPRLWASTRVGYLLDQLRLKGVNVTSGHKPAGPDKELVDEIIALATEYGIVTPYTALLVLEDSKTVAGPVTPAVRRLREAKNKAEVRKELESADAGLSAPSGHAAFEASREALKLQRGKKGVSVKDDDSFSKAMDMSKTIKKINDKTFIAVDKIWYDSIYKEGVQTVKVKFLSDEYFILIEKHPRLARYLSVGQSVVVCLDETVYEISP